MHSQDSQIRKQFNVIDYQEGHCKHDNCKC
jgi:hypothetical protein